METSFRAQKSEEELKVESGELRLDEPLARDPLSEFPGVHRFANGRFINVLDVRFSGVQRFDFCLIDIDTNHRDAVARELQRQWKPDVAAADDADDCRAQGQC